MPFIINTLYEQPVPNMSAAAPTNFNVSISPTVSNIK